MSRMAVTASIFSHGEISAAGRERLKGEREREKDREWDRKWGECRGRDRDEQIDQEWDTASSVTEWHFSRHLGKKNTCLINSLPAPWSMKLKQTVPISLCDISPYASFRYSPLIFYIVLFQKKLPCCLTIVPSTTGCVYLLHVQGVQTDASNIWKR